MGVDCYLDIPISVQPEFIVYSLAMAAGEVPTLDASGEPNVFTASDFVRRDSHAPLTYHPLTSHAPLTYHPLTLFAFSLHLNYYEDPHSRRMAPTPSWHLRARSIAKNIAILRTVAERWGGRLVFQDYDETDDADYLGQFAILGVLGSDERWERACEIAYTTPTAEVTPGDEAKAAYKETDDV